MNIIGIIFTILLRHPDNKHKKMTQELINSFHNEMISIYLKAKTICKYNATRFLQMVSEQGGLAAAKSLLHSGGFSDGLVALYECGRLDITMEALVLQAPWSKLFTEEELSIAKDRLNKLGYNGIEVEDQ